MSQTTTGYAAPVSPSAPTPLENPYVGPRPFTEEDSRKFFGREFEARELVSLLLAERVVLLYSPSGAGKTSLIQARLLAALRSRFQVLPVIRLNRTATPGDERPVYHSNRYVDSVLRCLDLTDPKLTDPGPSNESITETAERGRHELGGILDARPGRGGKKAELLILDQFEEVFTLDPTDRDAKADLFRQLGDALGHGDGPGEEANGSPLRWALIAMREEYLGALDPYLASLPNRLDTRYRLSLLDQKKTQAAIEGPAAGAGVKVDPDAAQQLFRSLCRRHILRPGRQVTDVVEGHYVDPVHLQIICQRLWDRLPVGKVHVTVEDITEMTDAPGDGTVDALLAEHYADAVKAAAKACGRIKERDIRLWIDQHLITRYGLRGQVLQDSPEARSIPVEARRVLLDACVLRDEERNEANWLELAHDRLIRPIKLDNDAWYEKNLKLVQLTALAWDKSDRPPGLLLTGQTLSDAQAWADANPDELTDLDRAFIGEGLERRRARRIRILQAVGAGILLAGIGLYFWWVNVALRESRARANLNQVLLHLKEEHLKRVQSLHKKSQAYHLAARAQLAAETDPERALFLAYHSSELDPGGQENSPVRAVLTEVLSKAGGRALIGHDGPIAQVDLTKKWVVTASQDKTVRLWPRDRSLSKSRMLRDTVQVLGGEFGHGKSILRFALNEAEDLLATASVDKTVRVWDLEHPGEAPTILKDPTKTITRVAFFDDGAGSQWVCGGGQDNNIYFWNLVKRSPGEPRTPPQQHGLSFRAHQGRVSAIFFDPVRRVLVSGAEDGSVRVWPVDRITGRLRAGPPEEAQAGDASQVSHLLMGHKPNAPVTDVEFAYGEDGRGGRQTWLVTASDDRTARLWRLDDLLRSDAPVAVVDPKASRESEPIRAYGDRVVDLGEVSVPIMATGDRIIDIDVDKGSRILVTGDNSGHAYIWRLAEMIAAFPKREEAAQGFLARGPEGYATLLEGHTNSITDITISPDGRWVATASSDNTARLWRVPGPGVRTGWKAPDYTLFMENRVGSVKFSSPLPGELGLVLLTGSDDETARVWKLDDLDREREELSIDLPRKGSGGSNGPGGLPRDERIRKEVFDKLTSAQLAERCRNTLLRRLDRAEIDAYVEELKKEFPDLIRPGYVFE